MAIKRVAKDSAAEVSSATLASSPFLEASSAMSTACLALPDTFSSSSMARSSRISVCFWLAMTLAACSLSRRCCSCASVIACSSWIFGSALALKAEFTFAPRYFHHRLRALNMRSTLTLIARLDGPLSSEPTRHGERLRDAHHGGDHEVGEDR